MYQQRFTYSQICYDFIWLRCQDFCYICANSNCRCRISATAVDPIMPMWCISGNFASSLAVTQVTCFKLARSKQWIPLTSYNLGADKRVREKDVILSSMSKLVHQSPSNVQTESHSQQFPEPRYTNTHKCTQTLILRLKRSHIGQFDGALLHPDSTAEGDQTADLLTDALAQLAATHTGDVSDLSTHTCSRCQIPASSLPSFLCQSSHRGICHNQSEGKLPCLVKLPV